MLDRIKASGYKAICITVDTASYSNRERPLLSRWVPMSQRNPPDPVWQASVTWETIERIRDYVDLPLMIKGVGTGEDAAICIEHGVDVVWVSNHGGRQLDHGLGTMDILPEVVDAVDGKAEIVLDGGVQRGSDVLKALCLGAKAVAIGKLQGWGLSANGSDGVYRVLEVLQQEMQIPSSTIVLMPQGISRDQIQDKQNWMVEISVNSTVTAIRLGCKSTFGAIKGGFDNFS